jgi:crossover junction endodeoxyribonuclease RusA
MSDVLVSFTVHGLPISQGSKNPFGGESNAKKLKPWRASIAAEAGEQMNGQPLESGPVRLYGAFYFPRPKSHYGTGRNAGVLKASAPKHITKVPDLDKLVRAVGDALTNVVLRDDAQIVHLYVWKLWGEAARCEITVERLP